VQLVGGKLDLMGHEFRIDHGTVNFTDRPDTDPLVKVTAYWEAPDGTRVYADFTGPLNEGDLTLRSEPSLTRDQIIALLQFGTPEGAYGVTVPGQTGTTATLAGAAVGNIATPVINRILSGVTTADISTRIDTSQAGNPKPEVAVQLSSRLSAAISYNVGVPPPGKRPDRTELRLDLRIVRAWVLEAVVGDRGSTSLDVLWRHRY
jgi:translocation and assembly module TamB